MTAHPLLAHQAADDLRTIAQLVDDGLPAPVTIIPCRYDYPTRISLKPEHLEAWRSVLSMPPVEWERDGADEFARSVGNGFSLMSVRPVQAVAS